MIEGLLIYLGAGAVVTACWDWAEPFADYEPGSAWWVPAVWVWLCWLPLITWRGLYALATWGWR